MLVVVLDFGIIYFGYVFFFKIDYIDDFFKIIVNMMWMIGSKSLFFQKILICFLLCFDKMFYLFGFEVEEYYLSFVDMDEYYLWYYFCRFKMFLYNNMVLG